MRGKGEEEGRKEGKPLWVNLRGWGMEGPHGELQEVRLVLLDVTERKRLEDSEPIREGSQR